jgi:hypothetical protein
MVGWTTSFSNVQYPGDTNVLIVQVDSAGRPMRPAKISTGQGADVAQSITDFMGGYAVTGWTRSHNNGLSGSDIFVCRLDGTCNLIWGRVFGGPFDDQAYSITPTIDHGLAITGWTTSFDQSQRKNIFILKLDQNGNIQWSKVYRSYLNNLADEGYSIVETYFSLSPSVIQYVVAGRTMKTEGQYTSYDAFVMWVDSSGSLINLPPNGNSNTVVLNGAQYNDQASSVIWDANGITVAGYTKNYPLALNDTSANIFLAKFSPAPVPPTWSKVYGWANADEMVLDDQSLIADFSPPAAYTISGLTYSKGPGTPANPNFLIMDLDGNGNVLWAKAHPSKPGAGAEEGYPIIRDHSSYYVTAGFTNSFGLGGDDFHLVALDPQGNRPVCVIPVIPNTTLSYWHNDSMTMDPATFLFDNFELEDTMVGYTEVCRTYNRWTPKALVPTLFPAKHVKDGGFIVTGHKDTFFAFRGFKSTEFYRFDIGPDTWTLPYVIESIPFTGKVVGDTYWHAPLKKYPGKGASMCFDGDSLIYAVKAGGIREFWVYNTIRNRWTTKHPVPPLKGIKEGSALAFKDDSVYLLAGIAKADSPNFFVYNPTKDSWYVRATLPTTPHRKVWGAGSGLTILNDTFYALKGNDKQGYLYWYDMVGDTWKQLDSIPMPDTVKIDFTHTPPKITLKKLAPKDGGVMAAGNGMLYVIKGGGSWALWEYTPGSGWSQSIYDTIPRLNSKSYAKTGAGLVYANDALWLMKGNNTPEFWQYNIAYGGKSASSGQWSNIVTTSQSNAVAKDLSLLNVVPNPFTKNTTIRYTVPVSGRVSISLYNTTGRLVKTLINENQTKGNHSLVIDNWQLKISRGVYFLRYETNNATHETKLIIE